MADDAAWEVAKLVIAATLGGGVSAYLQRVIPRAATTAALKADSRGALRTAEVHIPEFDAAAEGAGRIVNLIAEGKVVDFNDVTALREGWVFTAPSPDLLGYGQRFEENEAAAVMQYLHYWNQLVGLEIRYRAALDQFLKMLPPKTDAPTGTLAVLQEYATRVRDNARQLALNARYLKAQANHFFANRIQALTPEEEKRAACSAPDVPHSCEQTGCSLVPSG